MEDLVVYEIMDGKRGLVKEYADREYFELLRRYPVSDDPKVHRALCRGARLSLRIIAEGVSEEVAMELVARFPATQLLGGRRRELAYA